MKFRAGEGFGNRAGRRMQGEFSVEGDKQFRLEGTCPKGPCTQIVYALAPKYLYRDYYFKAKVYTI